MRVLKGADDAHQQRIAGEKRCAKCQRTTKSKLAAAICLRRCKTSARIGGPVV